ncbi:MAG: hypothetical protein OXC57_01615 [Rhodobacteraceae bacterium]|nr:hypothetical protein [Paracoccaceae bacterium]
MPLTLELKDLIKKRADNDHKFRRRSLIDAIEALINDDLGTCKIMLLSYIMLPLALKRLGRNWASTPKP